MSEPTLQAEVKALLAAAIRNRIAPGSRVFAVKSVEHGEVLVHSIAADTVQMSPHGHLMFFTKEGQMVRALAGGTWYSMRDVSSEGPDAVASFLKEMHGEGAGTA